MLATGPPFYLYGEFLLLEYFTWGAGRLTPTELDFEISCGKAAQKQIWNGRNVWGINEVIAKLHGTGNGLFFPTIAA